MRCELARHIHINTAIYLLNLKTNFFSSYFCCCCFLPVSSFFYSCCCCLINITSFLLFSAVWPCSMCHLSNRFEMKRVKKIHIDEIDTHYTYINVIPYYINAWSDGSNVNVLFVSIFDWFKIDLASSLSFSLSFIYYISPSLLNLPRSETI